MPPDTQAPLERYTGRGPAARSVNLLPPFARGGPAQPFGFWDGPLASRAQDPLWFGGPRPPRAALEALRRPEHTRAWRGVARSRARPWVHIGHRDFAWTGDAGLYVCPESAWYYLAEEGMRPSCPVFEAFLAEAQAGTLRLGPDARPGRIGPFRFLPRLLWVYRLLGWIAERIDPTPPSALGAEATVTQEIPLGFVGEIVWIAASGVRHHRPARAMADRALPPGTAVRVYEDRGGVVLVRSVDPPAEE